MRLLLVEDDAMIGEALRTGLRRDLEKSVAYYGKGAARDVTGDQGYTGINAAFMLDLLARAEPRVTHILTGNAETNRHMIAINETLGYHVIGKPERSWELPAQS